MAPSANAATNDQYLSLPLSIVTKVDVGRLIRELEQIDGFLKGAAIREPGTPVDMPRVSRLLDETATINKLNLLHDDDRKRLIDFVTQVRANAPIMHISFSADAPPAFTQKLITWLRTEIHPLVLLQIGLQPNIGAGSVVRTTNKFFDLSLREHLKQKGDVLSEVLKKVSA
jgi:hypothetical protein